MQNFSMENQRAEILAHLRKHGSLSTPYSRNVLNIPHPAGRVCELRKRGFEIETAMEPDHQQTGSLRRFARYYLKNPNGGNTCK